jgi:hypothetical protein
LLPPQYGLIVSVAGLVTIAAHHGYQAGGAGVQAAVDAAAKALKATAPLLVTAFLVAGVISGCKTVPSAPAQAGITVAVDIATGAAIQNGGNADVWKARAVKFKAIAAQVKQVNDAGTATLATLAADLEPQLKLLPPADQLAAHALVAALTPYIQQEVQANPDLANVRATLDVILQAVIDSCAAYGA